MRVGQESSNRSENQNVVFRQLVTTLVGGHSIDMREIYRRKREEVTEEDIIIEGYWLNRVLLARSSVLEKTCKVNLLKRVKKETLHTQSCVREKRGNT